MSSILAGPDSTSLLEWFAQQLLSSPIALVAFGLVLAYVCYYIVRIHIETQACRAWVRKRPATNGSQIREQLTFFTSEAERWRILGVAVPMTDYSDRIDSMIEGLSDNLHSGVNLFLVVGLAGTFLGMAEFGRQAPNLQQTNDPKVILDALRVALGHSFPIGFAGLCLTVIGHPIAALFDGRLRRAAKDAVNHALRLRTAALKEDGSNALIEEIRKLPEAIAHANAPSYAGLLEKLAPLTQIPDAIKVANEQALQPLRELFADSRTEWKQTVTKLDTQSKRMAEAIGRLEQPIVGLTGKIDDIGTLVASVSDVTRRVLLDAERVSATLGSLQEQVAATAISLASSADRIRVLPDQLRQDLVKVNEAVIGAVHVYYEGLGMAYVQGVQQLAIAASGDITAAATKAAGELNAAAISLRVAADAITPELKTAIRTGAEHLQQHLTEFDCAFRQHFPGAVRDLQTMLATASGQIVTSKDLLEAIAKSSEFAASTAQVWQGFQTAIDADTQSVQKTTVAMAETALVMQTAANAHGRVPAELSSSVVALRSAIDLLREPLGRAQTRKASKTWWERLWGGTA